MAGRMTAMAAALCLPLLALGCATPAPEPAPPRSIAHLLVAATSDGAVLLDRRSATYVGVDRSGRRVWTDPDAAARGASVVCVRSCPNAVVSGAVPPDPSEPAPVLHTAGARATFAVPAAERRTVLTARSAKDAVITETDAHGRLSLHLLRSGADERLPLTTPEAGWSESPDGTAALLLPRMSSGTTTVRWFVRDSAGWRATDSGFGASRLRDACVAQDGRTALLTGPEPVLVLDRTRVVPVRTDLPIVSECALGEQGGAVLARSSDATGHRTDVRGISRHGAQTWTRGYDTEAVVATDPAGRRTAIAHDGVLDVLDRNGQAVHRERNVDGVRFTAEGQLVVVTPDGAVRWIA